jgi:hypothetical protein
MWEALPKPGKRGPYKQQGGLMKDAALVSVTLIAIGLAVLLVFPNSTARAQSFSREDLDCAVAAIIEDAQADKCTAGENSFHELFLFFIRRLNVQDDQTNWARVVYDRSKLNAKGDSAVLLAKCRELYQSSLYR